MIVSDAGGFKPLSETARPKSLSWQRFVALPRAMLPGPDAMHTIASGRMLHDTHSSYIIWAHSLGNQMLNMLSTFTGFCTAGYRGGFQLGENDSGKRHDHQCRMTAE